MTKAHSSRDFENLAQRLFNVPLLLEPNKAEIICAALQQRLGIARFDRIDGTVLGASEMQALAGDARRSYGDDRKLFPVDQGVAVIHVDGTLVHKSGWIDPTSGMTGYDGITKKLRAAMIDPDVKGIWFDIDSPGGEVTGLFTLAEEIALSCKSEGSVGCKPIYAYVNEQACSAAYAIAAVCDKVYGPMDAMVGSIGSYVMHVDFTKALANNGVNVTIIRSAERKGRGTPYEEIDKATLVKLQSWVSDVGDRFCQLVAAGRRVSLESIVATEADWFIGPRAVELNLIDGILSEAEAWGLLQDEIARS